METVVLWNIKTQFVLHRRHYFSARVSKRLMLCEIWGLHGGDYEECRPLGCYAVWFLQEPHGVTSQKTPFFSESPVFANVSTVSSKSSVLRDERPGCPVLCTFILSPSYKWHHLRNFSRFMTPFSHTAISLRWIALWRMFIASKNEYLQDKWSTYLSIKHGDTAASPHSCSANARNVAKRLTTALDLHKPSC
jgi:hypothetical protein